MDYIGIIKERKMINGKLYRKYFIDSEGKEIGIPPHVVLRKVRGIFYVITDLKKENYPDSFFLHQKYTDKSSQEAAIKRCIEMTKTMTRQDSGTMPAIRRSGRKNEALTQLGLDRSEIPGGICVKIVNRRNTAFVQIVTSYFDSKEMKFRNKTMYLGTLSTWKERWSKRFQEAISLREESLKLYNELTQVTK